MNRVKEERECTKAEEASYANIALEREHSLRKIIIHNYAS